ncbi:MAG: hypothetical protein Q9220_006705 [cf. Caloplaca sp. 1 TL-2023]
MTHEVTEPAINQAEIYKIETAWHWWAPAIDNAPFCYSNCNGDPTEHSKKVLLARTREETTLRKRVWGTHTHFWTLYIYRRDFIVHFFKGTATIEPHWRRWLGYKEGYERKAIAFPIETSAPPESPSISMQLARQLEATENDTTDSDPPIAATRKRRSLALPSTQRRVKTDPDLSSQSSKRRRRNTPTPERDWQHDDADLNSRLERQMNVVPPKRLSAINSAAKTHEQYKATVAADLSPTKPKRKRLNKTTIVALPPPASSRYNTAPDPSTIPVSPPPSFRYDDTPVSTQSTRIKGRLVVLSSSSDSEEEDAAQIERELKRKEQDLEILEKEHRILQMKRERDELRARYKAREKGRAEVKKRVKREESL